MARVRLLNPEIYMDEEIAKVSLGARWLFAALWTLADKEGRLEDLPNRIRVQVFPYEPQTDVESMIRELADGKNGKGFLTRYEADGKKCIQIINFLKHQKPHLRETPSSLPGQRHAQGKPRLAKETPSPPVCDTVSVPVGDTEGDEPPMPNPTPVPELETEGQAIWAKHTGGTHPYLYRDLAPLGRSKGVRETLDALDRYLGEEMKNEGGKFASTRSFAKNPARWFHVPVARPRLRTMAEIEAEARRDCEIVK